MSVLRCRGHHPRLHGINRRVKTVPAMDDRPVFIGDAIPCEHLARPAPASVVLQTAADHVRLLIVDGNLVELANRNGVDEVPRSAVVITPMNPAIAPSNHVIRVRWINPHTMEIPVNSLYAIGRKL